MRRLISLTLISFALIFCGCRAQTDVKVCPDAAIPTETEEDTERITVIVNKNSRKYHLNAACAYALRMAEENRLEIEVPDSDYLREHEYEPCSVCAKEQNDENK